MNNSEKIEMAYLAENELSRLNRQFRIMEGDKGAFTEEAHVKIAKQRKVIETLRKEQHNLLINLKVANSKLNKKKDLELTKTLNRLLNQHQKLTEEINLEKSRLNRAKHELNKIEKQVSELKSNDITDIQWQEKVIEGQKIVKNLEDKLSVATKRYCAILAENHKLREQIEHYLKERERYKDILEKLSNKTNENKKNISDLLEQAIQAYDQREEWGGKLQELRNKNNSDAAIHALEMKELERNLDRNTKLTEFLSVKCQRRVMNDLVEKENRKREQKMELREKQLDLYSEVLQKIQEFVGENEVNKLMKYYAKQEEENFALFNYVNELHHELEVLNEKFSSLNKSLEEQRVFNDQRNLEQQETTDVLKEKFELAKIEADQEEEKVNEAQRELQNLLENINELFEFLRCDKVPILNLLGEKADINENNVMLYMGSLDRRVVELTKILIYRETMMERKARASLNLLKREKNPFSNPNSPREL